MKTPVWKLDRGALTETIKHIRGCAFEADEHGLEDLAVDLFAIAERLQKTLG